MSDPAWPPQPPVPPPPFAQALNYAQPAAGRRPGIITAIGVISIVVASLSLIGSALWALYAVMFTAMASVMPTMGPAMFGGFTPGGLSGTEAAQVMAALDADKLDEHRRAILANFVNEQGAAVFPRTSGFITEQDMRRAIVRRGVRGGVEGGQEASWYVMGKGRLEVGIDYAAWYPTASAPAAADANALSLAQANAVILSANRAIGGRLSDRQADILRRELMSDSQMLVVPGADSSKLRDAIVGAPPARNGGLLLYSENGGVMYLPPDAADNAPDSVAHISFGVGGVPATTAPSAALSAIASRMRLGGVLAALEALLSLGLAIYLLVIGILVFRFSRRGRRHHLIYAVLKLPLTVFFVVCWTILTGNMVELTVARTSGMAAAAPTTMGLAIGFGLVAAVSAIYPIALLVVLNTRTVREYYQTIGT
jgi:hypothetical protein